MFRTAFLVVVLIAGLHCAALSQTQTIIGTVSGGVATLSVSESTLISAIESDLNDGTDITSAFIDGAAGVYYVVGLGTKNGNCVRRGYLLNEDSGGNLRCADAETHTCSGVCCTSCDFQRDQHQNITGCQPCHGAPADCTSTSYCNHTKSSGTTGGYIGTFY